MAELPKPTQTDKTRKLQTIDAVLLLAPFVGLLFPWLYNTFEPSVLGLPFFYWYQLAWVPTTSVLIYIVYRRIR